MKRQGAAIGVAIFLTLVIMSWYLGWQVHQAQLARVGSFASYYQVLNGYLQTTNNELKTFAETDSAAALADCVSDMQTVERMAYPLAGLVPKAMSSFWTSFLDHNWNAVTKSLGRLATQNTYFGSGNLPKADQDFLQVILQDFQVMAELMDAPAVSQGDVPGVRIRLDQLMQLNKLADDLVSSADSYVSNGLLPSELPAPKVTWQEAIDSAREGLDLSAQEWSLIGQEKYVTELRVGKDYYYLHFEPTSDYQGSLKGVAVGIDRQGGQLVSIEWTSPPSETQIQTSKVQLEEWALKATEGLAGPKMVLETATKDAAQPAAVVVPLQGGVPVLMDYVLMSLNPETGEVTKWENLSWGSKPQVSTPQLSQSTASSRLAAQQDLDSDRLEAKGLAVVRSPYTGLPTLVYWFEYTNRDEKKQMFTVQYFVNAKNGKLERTGSGW